MKPLQNSEFCNVFGKKYLSQLFQFDRIHVIAVCGGKSIGRVLLVCVCTANQSQAAKSLFSHSFLVQI